LESKKPAARDSAYVVNYADEIHADDAVFEVRGVKVVVDPLEFCR